MSATRDKIIRCPVVLVGGPRNGERIHVPPHTDRVIRVIGRSRSFWAGVSYKIAPILTYELDVAPDPDHCTIGRFVSVQKHRGEPS